MRRRLSMVALAAVLTPVVPVAAIPALAAAVTIEVHGEAVHPGQELVFDLAGCPEGDHLAVHLGPFHLDEVASTGGDQPWLITAPVPMTVEVGGTQAPLNPGEYGLQVLCGDWDGVTEVATVAVVVAPPAAVPSGSGVSTVTATPAVVAPGNLVELPLPGGDVFGSDRRPAVFFYDDDGPRRLELTRPTVEAAPLYRAKVQLPDQVAGSTVHLAAFGETWLNEPGPIAVALLTMQVDDAPPDPTDPTLPGSDHLKTIVDLLKDGKPITKLPPVDGKTFDTLKELLEALDIPTKVLEGAKQLQKDLDAKQTALLGKALEDRKLQQKKLADETTRQKQASLDELQKQADSVTELEQEFARKQEELRRLREEAQRSQLEAERRRIEEQKRAQEELLRQLEEQQRVQEEQQRLIEEQQRQIAIELAKKLAEQEQSQHPPAPILPGMGNTVADHIVGIAGPLGVPLGPWEPLQGLPWTGGALDTLVPHDEDLASKVTTVLAGEGLLFPEGATPVALTGFEPNQTVVLAVESTLTPLAVGVADVAGVVRTTVELPDGIEAGAHTLYAVADDRATIVTVQVADIDDIIDAVLSVVVLTADETDDPAEDRTERVVTTTELPETGRGVLLLLALALGALAAGITLLRPSIGRRAASRDA